VNQWRKFQALNPAEQRAFLQALLLLPGAALTIKLFGPRSCWRLAARLRAPNQLILDTDAAREQAKLTAKMVRAAAGHGIYKANCLPQSLVLWLLLRKVGIIAEIRIGARKVGEQLQAHAWVEQGGVALNEHTEVVEAFPPFVTNFAGEQAALNRG
jgi:hypothetical protein